MTKEKLLNLISTGEDIDKVFDELDKVFLSKNADYMDLSREYYNRPNSFSMDTFRSKLKRFISVNYKETKSKKNVDFHELFFNLEFEPQTTHFENTYKGATVGVAIQAQIAASFFPACSGI